MDTELEVRKGYFSWDIQEGVKCASFLRRIYEEVGDVLDNVYILKILCKIINVESTYVGLWILINSSFLL